MKPTLARYAGYALSATCLAILGFYVDWSAFVVHLRNVRPFPVVLATMLIGLTYFLFALRWRLLLSFQPRLSLLETASYLMLGYLGNLMLPMRAGDATRVFLVRNAYGHGAARALSSVLLERLLDVIAVLLVGAAVAFVAKLPDAVLLALRISAAVAAIAMLVFGWIGVRPDVATTRAEKLMRPLGPDRARAFAAHVRQFGDALAIILPTDRVSAFRLVAVVVLTALGWGAFGAAMVLCTAALGVEPAVAAGLLLMVVTNLGSAIPSSPGSLGVYHALAVVALSAWPIGLDAALSVATVSHAVVIVVQLLLGLVALAVVRKRAGNRDAATAAKHDG